MRNPLILKLVLCIFFLAYVQISHADQLAYIPLEQAKLAKEYLSKQSHILLWCACCDSDTKDYLSVENVYYKDVDYKNLYQVVLQGRAKDGKLTTVDLDLAYTHALKNNLYHTVGEILNFECDPCTEPFEIDSINGYYSNPKYKSRTSDNTNIIDIIVTEENVVIHLIYRSPYEHENGGWTNIDSKVSIKNSDEKKTYKLLKAEGIPIAPNKMNSDFKGQYHSFKLFFPRISNLKKTIDIVECEKESCFNFSKILLEKKTNSN